MAELAGSERMKRTSPGGITTLGGRGGGGKARPEEDGLLFQSRRAELRTQLPPPNQIPAVGEGPHGLHCDEGGTANGLPRGLAEVSEGGEDSGA